MHRMRLIRQLHLLMALLIAGVCSSIGIGWSYGPFAPILEYWNHAVALLVTLLVAHFVGQHFLRRLLLRFPYFGSFLLTVLYGWISSFCIMLFGKMHAESGLEISIFPFALAAWLWPVTLLVCIPSTLLGGFLFRYLYQRRDYLPEEL